MATTLNFDTPKTGTPRPVLVTGTIARNSLAYLTVKLNITNSATAARNRSFYRILQIENATITAVAVNTSYTLSIVPKLLGSDTVGAVEAAWSYTV
ncbi:hypothetical protein [Clostridium sp.]|uniref:hypothetical protein n=1 Tax=Clostridium sp. TaxID=1506 RepID=UPI003D6CDD8E